jgi:hypothetical protein
LGTISKSNVLRENIFKLNLQDRVVLFSILLFQFFSLFSIVLIKVNSYSIQVFNSRISLQSRYGFGSEPSSTLIIFLILCFLVYLLSFFILTLIKSDLNFSTFQNFVRLVFPTFLLTLVLFARILINNLSLGVPEISGFYAFIGYLLSGNNWTLLFILNISVLISQIIIFGFKTRILIRSEKIEQHLRIIGWLIPISIFQAFNISKFYFDSHVISFFLLVLILLSLFIFNIAISNLQIRRLTLFVMTCFTLISICLIRIPVVLYSWRPEWTFIKIDSTYFVFFIISFVILLTLPIVLKKISINFTYLAIAAIYYTFAIPLETSIVPLVDSLHYGEKIGLWFNQEYGDLSPYSELEIHRGLLVNNFPAKIGNFISPGNPETFKFSFLIFALILGPLVFLALRNFIGSSRIISILLLLPVPNGLVEIEFLYFSFLLLVIYYCYRHKVDFYLIALCLFAFPILILLAPGQGIVFILLTLIVVFFNISKFNFVISKIKLVFSILFLISFVLIVIKNSLSIKSAVLWVVRTGSANSSMYGDNWIIRLYQTDQFPSNIRWAVLFIIPILIFLNIIYLKYLNSLQTLFIILIYVYTILMSGRWFARVDTDSPSRIGIGLITLSLFLIFPLVSTLRKKIYPYVFSLVFLIMLFFTIQAINFNPMISGSGYREISTPSSQALNLPVEKKLGQQYRDVSFLIRSIFGQNPFVTNISGGSASDFYMKIPSRGGIQSSYLIVSDDQELEWISRLEKSNVNLLYGGYSQLGGITADQTSLATRAPLFSRWSIANFTPFRCKDIYFAIKNTSLNVYKSKLQNMGCIFTESPKVKLRFWGDIDQTPKNFDNSFYMWKKAEQNFNLKLFDPKVIQFMDYNSNFWNKVRLDCAGAQGTFEIELYKITDGDVLRTKFSTALKDGIISWDSRIFPIFNLGEGKTFMSLTNSPCWVN